MVGRDLMTPETLVKLIEQVMRATELSGSKI